MKFAESHYDNQETRCCARLAESRCDKQQFVRNDKPFVKDHIHEFLHFPLNFCAVMARDHAALEQAQAYAPDPLVLLDEVSPWDSDVFLATDRDVPTMKMKHLSGTFLTRFFSSQYRDIGKWIAQTEAYVKEKGRAVEKLYVYYATCPKCAKYDGEIRSWCLRT
jgi:hypothetical protein